MFIVLFCLQTGLEMGLKENRRSCTFHGEPTDTGDGNAYSDTQCCSTSSCIDNVQYIGSKASGVEPTFGDGLKLHDTTHSGREGHRFQSNRAPAISNQEKCRTVRFIAAQWLSLLMNESPNVAMPPSLRGRRNQTRRRRRQQQQHQQQVTRRDEELSGPDGRDNVMAEEVDSDESYSQKRILPIGVTKKGASPTLTGNDNRQVEEPRTMTGNDTPTSSFELVPREETLPQLMAVLREVALAGASLSDLSPVGDEGEMSTSQSVSEKAEASVADVVTGSSNSGCTPAQTQDELLWKDIRKQLNQVCKLVHNRSELAAELNSTLGNDWYLSDDELRKDETPLKDYCFQLPPPQVSCVDTHSAAAASSEREASEPMEQQQQFQKQECTDRTRTVAVASAGSRLNRDAPPFHSRLYVPTHLSSSSTISADAPVYYPGGTSSPGKQKELSSPSVAHQRPSFTQTAESSSLGGASVGSPTVPLTTSAGASAASNVGSSTTSPSVTFNLESREGMIRRRTAAAAAAGVAANHYVHNSGGNFYSGGRSRGGWGNSHSPVVTYMNCALSLSQCPFDYLLVVDFEATCEEYAPPSYLHEIIEFPVVVVDAKLQRVITEFHRYVKPKVKPQLSEFCRQLTGIRQEDIDSAAPLEDVIKQFERWYAQTIPPGSRTVLVTDGPADLREFMYVHSVTRQGIRFPSMFYQWIDVKQVFAHFFQCQQGKIKAMLEVLQCPFEGRLHSGIDDARNIAKIVIRMLEVGCSFCEIPLCRLPYGTTTTAAAGPAQE